MSGFNLLVVTFDTYSLENDVKITSFWNALKNTFDITTNRLLYEFIMLLNPSSHLLARFILREQLQDWLFSCMCKLFDCFSTQNFFYTTDTWFLIADDCLSHRMSTHLFCTIYIIALSNTLKKNFRAKPSEYIGSFLNTTGKEKYEKSIHTRGVIKKVNLSLRKKMTCQNIFLGQNLQ